MLLLHAVTTAGLSLGDNSINFKIGVTSYILTTTMLKALVDNSIVWKTTDTDLSTCAKLTGAAFTGAITMGVHLFVIDIIL